MKLRDLPYKTEFYWNHERFSKSEKSKVSNNIFCRRLDGDYLCVFDPDKEVKPVLKPSDIKRLK